MGCGREIDIVSNKSESEKKITDISNIVDVLWEPISAHIYIDTTYFIFYLFFQLLFWAN